jgi:hypothetical protein
MRLFCGLRNHKKCEIESSCNHELRHNVCCDTMSTPDTQSVSPDSSELEQTQLTQSSDGPHYHCSPGRRLSMPVHELSSSSDEETVENDEEDRRLVNLWTPIFDETEKRKILKEKNINFRREYGVRRHDAHGSVYKCAVHDNCEFLVRILSCGGSDNRIICFTFNVTIVLQNVQLGTLLPKWRVHITISPPRAPTVSPSLPRRRTKASTECGHHD